VNYSREYNRIRATVEKQTHGDAELRSRYEQIVEQVRQTKQSTLQVDQRRFDAPVDQIQGTVKSASFKGVELTEYPTIRLGPLLPENINHLARVRDPSGAAPPAAPQLLLSRLIPPAPVPHNPGGILLLVSPQDLTLFPLAVPRRTSFPQFWTLKGSRPNT
jgi:hypothetical protein